MIKRGGISFLLSGACLAAVLNGCANSPDVAVRPVGAPLAGAAGMDALALARASLALGNVGLALQEYRQALRDQPQSTAALAGIAHCYDAMGRNDLSSRYYQEALATAPADTQLLRDYAAALGRQGLVVEAQAVISEIALRTKAPEAQWVIEPTGPVAVAQAGPPAAVAPPSPVTATAAVPVAAPIAPVEVVPVVAPVAAVPVTPHVARPAPASVRVAAAKVRLERLSLGEIALVTTAAPLWRPLRPASLPVQRVARAERVASPLASPNNARLVRLLNAARRQGLAGRSAGQLQQAGWRRLTIGDASRVRSASLILYPLGRGEEARRLGNRLRIGTMRVARRTDILVLLGRDSA